MASRMPAFPLTPSGKVDRRALADAEARVEAAAPHDDAETEGETCQVARRVS